MQLFSLDCGILPIFRGGKTLYFLIQKGYEVHLSSLPIGHSVATS